MENMVQVAHKVTRSLLEDVARINCNAKLTVELI